MGADENWGVTCDGLASCLGGIEIFLSPLLHETGYKHWTDWFGTDCTFFYSQYLSQ